MVKRTWTVVVYLYDQFFDDGCANLAASLTFSTLLALVPVLMITFALLSLFPLFQGFGDQLQKFIIANFVATSASTLSSQLNVFMHQLHQLNWVSFSAVIVISMLMIYNMVHAFNQIWHVKMEKHFAFEFAIYLLVLLVIPIILGVMMVLSSYLGSLSIIAAILQTKFVQTPMLVVFPLFVAFITFTFLNWLLPSCTVKFRYAAISGLISALLFESAKHIFVWYITWVPTYRLIYGALSVIPIFLVWIYVSWVIILLGGLMCCVMQCGMRSCGIRKS